MIYHQASCYAVNNYFSSGEPRSLLFEDLLRNPGPPMWIETQSRGYNVNIRAGYTEL